MPCRHSWRRVNQVDICVKCGLTRVQGGKLLFDRKLANYRAPGRRRGGKEGVACPTE